MFYLVYRLSLTDFSISEWFSRGCCCCCCSQVLGVEEHAPLDEVNRAYKRLSLVYHPDKTKGMAKQQQEDLWGSGAVSLVLDIKKRQKWYTLKWLICKNYGIWTNIRDTRTNNILNFKRLPNVPSHNGKLTTWCVSPSNPSTRGDRTREDSYPNCWKSTA